jgi:glutamate synthase (NADPH/NADH) large chain/glutamate synthase (ferredoxin)
MTGGVVLVLGGTGKNFGAGMTGGVAYVLDLDDSFPLKLNTELVVHERLAAEEDMVAVKELVYKHLERTESDRAKEILGDWHRHEQKFWKIRPINIPTAPKADFVPPRAAEETSVARS